MNARRVVEELLAGELGGDKPSSPPPPPSPQGGAPLSMETVLNVFPPEVQQRIIDILNDCAPDVSAASKQLKPIFRQYADGLQALGLLPDWAAYAIPHAVYSQA